MTSTKRSVNGTSIAGCLSEPLVALPCSEPLGALLLLQKGCRALWVGSLECSTMRGLPDQYVLNATDMSTVIFDIQRAIRCSIPLLVDVDAGYGGLASVEDTFVRLGILRTAVGVMENKRPGIDKRNSLARSGNSPSDLLHPDAFRERIGVAVRAARSVGDTWVCPRFEDLAVGRSVSEAMHAIDIVMTVEPDAVFVSCRDEEPDRLFNLLSAIRKDYPGLPLLTTTGRYRSPRPDQAFFDAGVNLLIYSHHAARGKIRALGDIYDALLGSARSERELFCSLDEVIDFDWKR
jgi:2-methylisocitrate lyase-like PEP mutase family enzyme